MITLSKEELNNRAKIAIHKIRVKELLEEGEDNTKVNNIAAQELLSGKLDGYINIWLTSWDKANSKRW